MSKALPGNVLADIELDSSKKNEYKTEVKIEDENKNVNNPEE